MSNALDPDPEAFSAIRAALRRRPKRPLSLGLLVGAAAFAALAAVLSAAAVILGAPGIDKGAVHQETAAWGAVRGAPSR